MHMKKTLIMRIMRTVRSLLDVRMAGAVRTVGTVLALMSAGAAAVSCVYPFEGEVGESDRRLVVQGDIVLGDRSIFTVTYLEPLFPVLDDEGVEPMPSSGSVSEGEAYPRANVWVEDEDGGKYPCSPLGKGEHVVDMPEPDSDRSYRLCILANGRQYSSAWETCQGTVQVDDLYYEIDESGTSLDIKMDFHSDSPSSYYGISFRETWEYHAPYKARYMYYPPGHAPGTVFYRNGNIVPLDYPDYRCWKTVSSRGFHVLGAEHLSSAVFKEVEVARIDQSDERISACYRIQASVTPLSEDAYLYLSHVEGISSSLGDLFSPNPSEMKGNVICESDKSEMVVGYVSVVRKAGMTVTILDSVLRLYRNPSVYDGPSVTVAAANWLTYYRNGWVPYEYDDFTKQAWWTTRDCADCRFRGGTTVKPQGWPVP